MPLQATAAPDDPDLLFLPWAVPLEEWPQDQLVSLPRGISRHVVRFVRMGGRVYAVKEVGERLARHEYQLLRDLARQRVPCVEAVGVVTGRETPEGEPLDPALVTRHLEFSLPYRALFSSTLRPDTAVRLLDALSLLIVRLHLTGFAWQDCSLSNTLFRRDAGSFAAYLVDAETGELHAALTDGQRKHDLEIARVNIFGELSDLRAGGMLHDSIDPLATADSVIERYSGLWEELTRTETVPVGQRHLVDARIRRLNDLGFDVAEVSLTVEPGGWGVSMRPQVVDPGHHSGRLLRLTGIDAEENQARRLLNDLDAYRAESGPAGGGVEEVAHRWVAEVFEPVVRSIPRELRGKLEPAEVFHEVLEHRWFLSEREGRDVGMQAAADSYLADVLTTKPDEQSVLGIRVGAPSDDTAALRLVLPVEPSEPRP